MYKKKNFHHLIKELSAFDQTKVDELSHIFKSPKNYVLHFLCKEQLDNLFSKAFPSKAEKFKIYTFLSYLKTCSFDNLDEYIDNMSDIFSLDKNNYLSSVKEHTKSFDLYEKEVFFMDCLHYKNIIFLNKILEPFENLNKNCLSSWESFKNSQIKNIENTGIQYTEYVEKTNLYTNKLKEYVEEIKKQRQLFISKTNSINSFIKKEQCVELIMNTPSGNRSMEEMLDYYAHSLTDLQTKYSTPQEANYFLNLANNHFIKPDIETANKEHNIEKYSVTLKFMNLVFDEIDKLKADKNSDIEEIIFNQPIKKLLLKDYLNELTLAKLINLESKIVLDIGEKIFSQCSKKDRIELLLSIENEPYIDRFVLKLISHNMFSTKQASKLFEAYDETELSLSFSKQEQLLIYQNESFESLAELLSSDLSDKYIFDDDAINKFIAENYTKKYKAKVIPFKIK